MARKKTKTEDLKDRALQLWSWRACVLQTLVPIPFDPPVCNLQVFLNTLAVVGFNQSVGFANWGVELKPRLAFRHFLLPIVMLMLCTFITDEVD